MLFAAAFLAFAIALPASAITFAVDSTADTSDPSQGDGVCGSGAGTCTLRAAIQEANATLLATPVTITTTLPVGSTITPATLLPVINHPVTIGLLDISIYGSPGLTRALSISAGPSTIEVKIYDFTTGDALLINGNNVTVTRTTIDNCNRGIYVGGTGTQIGAVTKGNTITRTTIGIILTGAHSTTITENTIGGSGGLANVTGIVLQTGTIDTSIHDNVISGNTTAGITVLTSDVSNTTIEKNRIGVDSLDVPLPNGIGVNIQAGSNTEVGSFSVGSLSNMISGNGTGILVGSAVGTTIINNAIGTNYSGTAAFPNNDGISVTGGNNTTLGTGGNKNLISGNSGNGIVLYAGTNIAIRGNFIGTDLTGTSALPNQTGIFVAGLVNGLEIGGANSGDGNLISGNAGDGIHIIDGDNIELEANLIGTTANGSAALPNARGILVDTTYDPRIGLGIGNTISGNTGDGVTVMNGASVTMSRNIIGLNSAGTAAVPNNVGITISGGTDTSIGLIGGAAGNTISGNTTDGVRIAGGSLTVFYENRIGLNLAGTAAVGNGTNGVHVSGGDAAIGVPGRTNVIGGNTNGILIDGVAPGRTLLISSNRIGINLLDNAVPNTRGIVNQFPSTSTLIENNVISGNSSQGIRNELTGAADINGNTIGLNSTGTAAVPNGSHGILNLNGALTITANVISGNAGSGINHFGTFATTIKGNIIGLNAAGTAPIGNGQSGISVQAMSATIGGTGGTDPNTIGGNVGAGITLGGTSSGSSITGNFIGTNGAFATGLGNGAAGIEVTAGVGNAIGQNSIANNGGLGIDLDPVGVTANDPGDGDGGPNNLQNTPVLTSANETSASGTINSIANTSFRIEIFANDVADGSGAGEGKQFVGSTNVTTDGAGNATFTVGGLSFGPSARFVSSTATNNSTNDTSEFSNNVGITPNVSIGNVSQAEGTGGSSPMPFPVTLTRPSSLPITVNYSTANGTATTADVDYLGIPSGNLTIPAGNTSGTISILIGTDSKFEANETFTVTLNTATNANIASNVGTATILNDDAPPEIGIIDALTSEGNGGTTTYSFTVTVSDVHDLPITVTAQTADGTATSASGDYTAVPPTTITFPPNVTAQTFFVNVNGDTAFEPDETFFVNLSGATNATITDNQGLGTILNDDPQPTISINDVTANEGSALTFTVSLSSPSSQTITVSAQTADGTALSASDYTATGPTVLTFAPGVTSQTFTVNTTAETAFEPDETFFVNLSGATNATIADNQGLGTITNDDSQPTITINDVAANEGAALTFTVSLSNASSQTITVSAQTADGTASSTSDYTATGPTVLTFAAGVTTQTFTVNTTGDTTFEPNETFFVNLSGATNATIADNQGLGTINNDDAQPTISINDVAANEGTALTFTVTLSNASSQTITVSAQTADGTALSASDYTAAGPTTLTFAPGVLTQTFTVNTTADTTFEPNETFLVNLSGAANATIADNQGTGTITNNDTQPAISINDVTADEGVAFTFTVTLSNASSQTITVSALTADGSASSASDYTATGPTTLTFAPGVLTQTFTVNTTGDTAFEADETFFVNLTAPVNATIADNQGLGTITNDDAVPSINISDVSVNESAGNATFTITLTNPSSQTVTVSFSTADSSATQPADYTVTASNVTFAPGILSQTVSVPVIDDALNEAPETFFGNLSLAVNGVIADGQGVATIADNDPAPSLSISNAGALEGQNAVFTVTLSPASGQTVTVAYSTTSGSATAGSDFTTTSGTLTFAPGQTTQTISVPLLNDGTFEAPETFTVTLSGAANASITTASGTATINDALSIPMFDAHTMLLFALALSAVAVIALRR